MIRSLQYPIEVPCLIDAPSPAEVINKLPPEVKQLLKLPSDDSLHTERIPQDVLSLMNNCATHTLSCYQARSVYRIYKPVTCTLAPEYTEPAIKIVGTMMMLKGKAVYRLLSCAQHCAVLAATLEPLSSTNKSPTANKITEALQKACALALVKRAIERVNAAVSESEAAAGLKVSKPLYPAQQDFPLEARSQLVFYSQAEKLLHFGLNREGEFEPCLSAVALSALYDPAQIHPQRACGLCKHRATCSIRAINMNCHGTKGSFN